LHPSTADLVPAEGGMWCAGIRRCVAGRRWMKAVETVETVSDSGERVIFFSFSMISSSFFFFFFFFLFFGWP